MNDVTTDINDAERSRRRKKNLKRKLARQRIAVARAMPPLVALSKAQFVAITGLLGAEYDAYAEQFIAAAKAAHRNYEFPLAPAGR